ncbi:MAG: orotidine-5'-phosphate decarboxylase [Candidatus Paceibacterota bacterium]
MKTRLDDSRWLTPGERDQAIGCIIRADLLKWDNSRKLPLKMGGTTDIYANLRNMRSKPQAIRQLGELYANALRRLDIDRIVEVPEAVSPLAGHISAITGIPLVTVREEIKAGRVTTGRFVGDLKPGDRVAIIDDVITDGASKLTALSELRSAGAEVVAIVVLVDRQQGWKKKFSEAGFSDINVWAGMTLHDIRKYLVTNGLMQRCDPAVEAKNPFIMALDGGKHWEDFLPVLDRLRPSGCILKANDLLFVGDLNQVISDLSVYGRVMVDPKWHDIPNTVANYCRRLHQSPPWGVTVHASGGSEMIKAAVKALEGTKTIVLAITVLTSLKDECHDIYGRQPLQQVDDLAALAWHAGARGFVCSAEEASMLRAKYPEATIVVPGLRSPDKSADDQKRVATFAAAKEAGASHFVGGRQFLTSPDPVAEVLRVMKEELHIEA